MTPTAAQPTGPPRPTPPIALTALHDLHHDHYLRYAALLLPVADAPLAVGQAFDDLARHWPDVLATESPAAWAWQTVRHRVAALAGPRPFGPVAHLTAPQQDLVLLHLVLDLPEALIAELTGTAPTSVRAQIRSLTHRPADRGRGPDRSAVGAGRHRRLG
ncbi:hypothetical protein [Kitasatospora purpeofusca]|uniref:hypothetical protein n=1 Tax=Kitasatospora purpeofusca TaxID=67352 RepID=UPI00380C2578